jgi:hypothetical protein
LIRAAPRGFSIFERHSLRRFAARVIRSHRRDHARHRASRRLGLGDVARYGDRRRRARYDDDDESAGRLATGMSDVLNGLSASALHLRRVAADDEREALLIVLDFLMGSSIDDIATARRGASRSVVENALRVVMLKYGFKASQEQEP